jgi:hypothetical protein
VIKGAGTKNQLRLEGKELLRNYSAISTVKSEPQDCLTLAARSSLCHRRAILDPRICPTFSTVVEAQRRGVEEVGGTQRVSRRRCSHRPGRIDMSTSWG